MQSKLDVPSRRDEQLNFLVNEYIIGADEANDELAARGEQAVENTVERLLREHASELSGTTVSFDELREHHQKRGFRARPVPGPKVIMVNEEAAPRRRRDAGVVKLVTYTDSLTDGYRITVDGIDITDSMVRNERGMFTQIEILLPIHADVVEKVRASFIEAYLSGESIGDVYRKWDQWRFSTRHEAMNQLNAMPIPFDFGAIQQYMDTITGGDLDLPYQAGGSAGKKDTTTAPFVIPTWLICTITIIISAILLMYVFD